MPPLSPLPSSLPPPLPLPFREELKRAENAGLAPALSSWSPSRPKWAEEAGEKGGPCPTPTSSSLEVHNPTQSWAETPILWIVLYTELG